MRIGKLFLVTSYVIVLLLSDTHLAGVTLIERAVTYWEDSLRSFLEKEENITNGDGFCHVVYALNGGENHSANKTQLAIEDFPIRLEVPTREGYNFAGWYTDGNFKNKIIEIINPAISEMVLYAKWTPVIDNYHNVESYSYKLSDLTDEKKKTLTECKYQFLEYISIPSMPATRESDYLNNYISKDAQCMQGLCYTPDYILMTAYSESENEYGSLMVFDRESGEFLVTLAMKRNSHLGGVAFDGKNIWICHSEDKTLERLEYSWVSKIAESGAKYYVDVSGITEQYPIANSPSCITCFGGRIWVATHNILFDGEMVSYSFDEEIRELLAISEYKIPKCVQGVAFDENGSIYFSTSYGRKNSSYLKAYTSLLELEKNLEEPAVEVEMPPCSEEIVCVEDSLKLLFESASEKYFEGTDGNGISAAPLDSLLEIEKASLWEQNCYK